MATSEAVRLHHQRCSLVRPSDGAEGIGVGAHAQAVAEEPYSGT